MIKLEMNNQKGLAPILIIIFVGLGLLVAGFSYVLYGVYYASLNNCRTGSFFVSKITCFPILKYRLQTGLIKDKEGASINGISCSDWDKRNVIPMYGVSNEERYRQCPVDESNDAVFINSVTTMEGKNKIEAAKQFIEYGRVSISKGNLDVAMRRFNEAWLLDPNNADIYFGFAMVLYDKKEYGEVWKYVVKAESLGGIPNKDFINELSSKMPRSTQ